MKVKNSFMTVDETLAHHCDSEMKHQDMEYYYKPTQSPSFIRTTHLYYFFWKADGVIHMAFLEPGTTIISECYIATLNILKQRLNGIWKNKMEILLRDDNTMVGFMPQKPNCEVGAHHFIPPLIQSRFGIM